MASSLVKLDTKSVDEIDIDFTGHGSGLGNVVFICVKLNITESF